jgi:hypothetical protein
MLLRVTLDPGYADVTNLPTSPTELGVVRVWMAGPKDALAGHLMAELAPHRHPVTGTSSPNPIAHWDMAVVASWEVTA